MTIITIFQMSYTYKFVKIDKQMASIPQKIPSLSQFGNDEHVNIQQSQKFEEQNSLFHKADNFQTTQKPILEQEPVTRSLKKTRGNYKISFEQGFMEQHIEVIRNSVRNFMESSQKQQSQHQEKLIAADKFYEEKVVTQKLNLLGNQSIPPHKRKQFIVDLENEEKLSELLNILADLYPRDLVDELVYVAFLCWETHIRIRKPWMDISELQKIADLQAQEITQYEFEGELFKCLKMRQKEIDQEKDTKSDFQKFMKIYCTTIFLVIEQYFENPYKNAENGSIQNIDESCSFSHYLMFEDELSQQFMKNPSKKIKQI